ncbi:FxsB family cyclophane-forming radical SAM/SPASM peptide maturase [Embleya sp. NPDC008237]|uniref:FxsB family cyclophane-forming radical SAM/SPASM peptide maturase n=1 Tax=Embleya sp. NPDC008237 TaxID=3363978 RepID=UPI0036EF040C
MTQPPPFRQFVVKLHSRCNLACDHCYVYEARDTSWRSRPRAMSAPIMRRLAERIARHADRHELPVVHVALHGGEPLLAGRDRVDTLAGTLRAALPAATALKLSVQTNGTLVDPEWMALFHRHGIRVGVSLDGDADANDRHRRRRDGTGSHTAAIAGIALLRRPEHRSLYAGLLCTVDLANDPVRTYEALLAHQPARIDFLLPHANRQFPPPGHDPLGTPYARWLLAVFTRWYESPVRETSVRLFDDIMAVCLGGSSRSEAVGLSVPGFLVVATDGAIEQADSLHSSYDRAAATGLNVLAHDFDAAARHPQIAQWRLGEAGLADACRACEVMKLCGGGIRAHRYLPASGFANPSVYCADLEKLTGHIRDRVRADTRELLRSLP